MNWRLAKSQFTSLSITGNTSLRTGQTSQLQAVANYNNGTSQTVTATSVWMSSAPTTATVAAGLVIAVLPGSATVTANYSGMSAQVTVQVTP